MGSCASSKLGIASNSDKLVMPSPINDQAFDNGDCTTQQLGGKPQHHHSNPSPPHLAGNGSKEENFFESQAWLDSDCDDDFLSVNGEFTPSHSDTPAHRSFTPGIPQVRKSFHEDSGAESRPEPSPTDHKKTRLSDLFNDSLRVNQDVDEHNTSGSLNEKPHVSVVQSSEITPTGKSKANGQKSPKSVQCCLPGLRSSRSFRERKKKTSPYHNIG